MGMKKLWSSSLVPSFVVPVAVEVRRGDLGAVGGEGVDTAEGTGPHAGDHAGGRPAASPIGTMVLVAVDWLVVSAATRKTARAKMNSQFVTHSPMVEMMYPRGRR